MSQPPRGPQGPGRPSPGHRGPGPQGPGPGGTQPPWGPPPAGHGSPPPAARRTPPHVPSAQRPAPGYLPPHQAPPGAYPAPTGGQPAPNWPPDPASRPRGIDQGDVPAPTTNDDEEDAPRRGDAGLLIIGLLLGILVLGGGVILFLFWQGTFTTYVMDNGKVEEAVAEILQDPEDGFGIASVSSVSCPTDQEIVVKATFNCTVSIDGEEQRVPVDILNEDGDFRVNQPK